MAQTKTETLTVRVLPEVKEALRAMAGQERRSLANMLEVMIREYCGRKDVSISGQQGSKSHNKQQR